MTQTSLALVPNHSAIVNIVDKLPFLYIYICCFITIFEHSVILQFQKNAAGKVRTFGLFDNISNILPLCFLTIGEKSKTA